MNNNKQLKLGVVLNYINIIVGTLIPIFYTPIMLRLLGQSEYGLYKLSATFTSYLGLVSFGIGSAVSRYLIKARVENGKNEEEKYFGLFITIFRFISFIAFIIGIVLVFTIPIWYGESLNDNELSRMKILVFIMVCNTVVGLIQSPYVSAVSSHERFVFLQIINIILTYVSPIINLIVLLLGYKSIGITISSLVVSIIVRFVYYIYCKRSIHLIPNYKEKPKGVIKEILIFSFWIFIGTIVDKLYASTDTVMIGAIPSLATKGVAVYNVGTVFNNMVLSLTTGISTVITPRTNKIVFEGANHEELTNLSIKVGRLQCYIVSLIVTGFIVFGKPFIEFYAGYEYKDAYWVAIFVMIPYIIPLAQSCCLSIVIAQNKHRFRALVYLFIAILNVIGTWFALHKWGVIGAAAVSGIALVLGQGLIMNWYYKNKTGIDVFRFWKEVSIIFIIPTIMCAFALIISRYVNFYNIPIFIFSVAVYTAIFCILNWRFILNNYEKKLFLIPLKKVFLKSLKR